MVFVRMSVRIATVSLDSIKQLIVTMETDCVFFEVRIIYTSFGFRVLNDIQTTLGTNCNSCNNCATNKPSAFALSNPQGPDVKLIRKQR
jgi:hypothetical protein